MAIIQLEHVSKKISKKNILTDINLTVDKGEICGFSGPNGSGKSMLFNTIIGFVKPDEGLVTVAGKKIRKDVFFADDIAFSMDNVGILEEFSGQKNLMLIKALGDSQLNIAELLQYVGLKVTDQRKVRDYSLGMKKRLSLACALINQAPILILDEPSNALDDKGKIFLKKLISDQKKKGVTILISNHDQVFLEEVSDRIINISEGQLV